MAAQLGSIPVLVVSLLIATVLPVHGRVVAHSREDERERSVMRP